MPKQKEFIRIYLNKNDHEKVEENHSVYHHRAHRHHQQLFCTVVRSMMN
jgi:hypothetical protein